MIRTALALFLLTGAFMNAQVRENADKPLKGIWDFNLKKEWAIHTLADHSLLIDVFIIRIDEGNHAVYLLDRKQHKVFILDSQGKLIKNFGRQGEGPGEFMDIARFFNMALVGDKILIHEINTRRVHQFAKNGQFLTTKRIMKVIYSNAFKGFINPGQFLYVIKHPQKQDYSTIGIYDLENQSPRDIMEIAPEKDLTLKGKETGNVTIKSPSLIPSIVATVRGQEILYGKNDQYQITVIDFKGNKKRSFLIKGRNRNKISQAEKESRFVNSQLSRAVVQKLVANLPGHTTYFDDIKIGPAELIYVRISHFVRRGYVEYDIFSKEGIFLYTSKLPIPPGYKARSNLAFNKSCLYVFLEDEEGECELVKFSLNTPTLK